MMSYDVIVIGAGNAGLSAAATLAIEGKRVLVLEKHNIPGGCGTSFRRGRFEFEVALHQLSQMGSPEKPGPLRQIFKEYGIESSIDWIEIEDLYKVILPGRFELALPADKEKSIKALSKQFPEQEKQIKEYYKLVWGLCEEYFELLQASNNKQPKEGLGFELKKLATRALFGTKFPLLSQYAMKTSQEVLDELFDNKEIQLCVNAYWSFMGMPPARLPFTILAACTYLYIVDKPYYLRGGSQVMSQALTEVIHKNGGEVRFNCGAKKLILDKSKVVGVVTDNDEEIKAKRVLSNISPIHTYINLLEPDEIPEEAVDYLKSYKVGCSAFTCFIGLDCPPEELGFKSSFNLIYPEVDVNKGFASAYELEMKQDPMVLTCYTVDDPQVSPKGTSVVSAVTLKYAEPWVDLSMDQYYDKKFECANVLVDRITEQFPGFRDHIEEIEVATPLTHMRYLHHPGGAIYGFEQDVKSTGFFYPEDSKIEGLEFASGWVRICGFGPNYILGNRLAKRLIGEGI